MHLCAPYGICQSHNGLRQAGNQGKIARNREKSVYNIGN